MKFLAVSAVIGAVSALETTNETKQFEFMQWIAEQGKSYATANQFAMRFKKWLEIDDYIVKNNADPTSTHVAGHNHLSDFTEEELKKMNGAFQPEIDPAAPIHEVKEGEPTNGGKNWQGGSCVTAVKNQGTCGSCWAFSAVECMESTNCIKSGNEGSREVEKRWKSSPRALSPQQYVDCSTANSGCNGGWPYKAFAYNTSHGQMSESQYSYTGRDGSCKYKAPGVVKTTGSGYTKVGGNNSSMESAINKNPVSVVVNGSTNAFKSYRSGVVQPSQCSTKTDHAVVATGYQSGNGGYWIVRNSWGASWGNQGYIWLSNSGNTCGVQSGVYYPNTTKA